MMRGSGPDLDGVGSESVDLGELRLEVRAFLVDELAAKSFVPSPDAWQASVDFEFSRRLAERGWVGMTIPTEYGGRGRSNIERFVVTEELLAAGAPVAAHWIADRQMGPGILRNGTEEQKRRYLPGIAKAELSFSIGMSEPDAGSDLAAVRTRAREVDNGWELSGTKVWTSGAHFSTSMVVLARTDSCEDRHGGLTQFIVDLPQPGIDINPIRTIDGEHKFNEVVFKNAVIPTDALLGQRGSGWHQVTQELANERSGPERILTTIPLLIEWASTIARDDQVALVEVGRLTARASALRKMSMSVARKLESGGSPEVEAAVVKDLGTAFEGDLVETVRRLAKVGSTTERFETMLKQAQLHAPSFTLRGGSNEILRSVVAKALVS